MAVSFVRDHTPGNTKTSGTNNASATIAADVAAGNLLVLWTGFDNAPSLTDPFVTGVSVPAGETATWAKIAFHNSTTSTGTSGVRGEMWAIKTTVAWPSGTVVTPTLSAAVASKAVVLSEFAGASAAVRGTAGNGVASAGNASASTSGPLAGDLVLGGATAENTGTFTTDTDTVNGAWAGPNQATTVGGVNATNVMVALQYKVATADGAQTFNPGYAASDSGAAVVALVPSLSPINQATQTSTAQPLTAFRAPRYADAVLADSPVGYWKFEETSGTTAADSSTGGHPGTYVSGPTLGAVSPFESTDRAASFDGVDDYVDLPYFAGMHASTFTYEALIKPSAVGGVEHPIIGQVTSSGFPDAALLRILTDGRLEAGVWHSTGGWTFIQSPSALVAGTAYHVAMTYDGTTLRLYVNGSQVASAAGSYTVKTLGMRVGRYDTPAVAAFAGVIDEPAIYTTALSAARIAAHSAAAQTIRKVTETDIAQPLTHTSPTRYRNAVLADSPRAYWEMGDTGTVAVDSSGNALDGTWYAGTTANSNAGATTAVPGAVRAGTARTLSSASKNWAALGNPTALQLSDVTLEAWVKTTDAAAFMGIIVKNQAYGFYVNAGKLTVYDWLGASGTAYAYATPINDGQWHHVVYTSQNGVTNGSKFYVDGVDVLTFTSHRENQGTAAVIGAGNPGGANPDQYFNGSLDELAIYPGVLSAARVKAHYDAGKDARGATLGQATQTSEAQRLKLLEISQVTETDTAWQVHPPVPAGGQDYQALVKAAGPTGYWRLDESSGTLAADYSGNGLNGTHAGSPNLGQPTLLANKSAGKSVQYLTGHETNIAHNALLSPANAQGFTFEAWVKISDITGNSRVIFDKSGTSGTPNAYSIYTNPSYMRILAGGATLDWTGAEVATLLAAGGHLSVVAGPSGIKVYWNGVLKASTPTVPSFGSSTQQLTLGSDNSTFNFFLNGWIDEVAFYRRELSQAEVQSHYTAGTTPYVPVVGQASENDTAGVLSLGIFQTVNQATETDTAATLRTGLLTVFETDIAQPIAVLNPPDPFAQPWVIAGEAGVFVHDMTNSTTEAGEPLPAGVVKTAWFQWTAPDTRAGLPTRFHTRGSDGDTTLRVYTGSALGALTLVASSDDAYGDDADLRFNVVSGTTYRIQLGVKAGAATNAILTWFNADPETYDAFATPLLLESDYGSEEFSLNNGTTEAGEPLPAGSTASSWLVWTADTDQPVTFNFRSFDTASYTVRVYYGSTLGTLTQVVEATGTGLVPVTVTAPVQGRTYQIQISSGSDLSPGFEVAWFVQAVPVEPVPLPTPDAADFVPRVPLHAFLYEADGVTMVTEIPRRMGVSLQEPLNTVGTGALSISLNDEILNIDEDVLRWGRRVKFFLGSKCIHSFQIKQRVTSFVKSDEYKGFIVTIGGPSSLFELENFIVRHDGKPRPDSPDNRFYSWASKPGEWYQASDWNSPVSQNSLTNPPSAKKQKKPKNWKVRDAKWIWSPGPYKYFRKTISIKEDGTLVRIFAAADEWYRVYVDGEQILDDQNNEIGYTKHKRVDLVLSKGNHTFAAIVRGIHSANIGDGNDSFLFAMCKLDLDGKIIRPALLVSDNTWECHIGNPPPGWNRAQVLRNVVKEARGRGIQAAQRLTFGFDGSIDSEGKPWPKVQFNQEVSIGTSALNLQAQLSEGNGFDVWVDPADFTLEAWKRRGKNKSASVTLEPGRNLLDWTVTETDNALNKWLIQYDGGWTDYDAKGSQEDLEIRESYVSLGSVKDEKSAQNLMKRVAQGIAKAQARAGTGDIRKRPNLDQPEGGLVGVPGAYPFLDFGVGDVVSGPNRKGKMVPVRVLSLTLNEDPNGNLSFDPDLEEVD